MDGHETNSRSSLFMRTHPIKEDVDTSGRYEKFTKHLCGKTSRKKLTWQA